MAFNESLAKRVRHALASLAPFQEKNMFGGLGFFVNGNMACGVYKDHMIVRVGSENYEALLKEPFAKVFDITGRSMSGWIMVDIRGLESDDVIAFWAQKGIDFASTLPYK